MSKITLHCHGEVNFITCLCGYTGTCYISNLFINKIVTTGLCRDHCEMCHEKSININITIVCGKKMKTATLFVKCSNKVRFWNICAVCHCTKYLKEKECYDGYLSCDDGRKSEGSGWDD